MSKMKLTLTATFLTLVLTVPALAGQIGSPGASRSPLEPTTTVENVDLTGSSAAEEIGSDLSSFELVNILITVFSLI